VLDVGSQYQDNDALPCIQHGDTVASDKCPYMVISSYESVSLLVLRSTAEGRGRGEVAREEWRPQSLLPRVI
jgi:hypothetical protein